MSILTKFVKPIVSLTIGTLSHHPQIFKYLVSHSRCQVLGMAGCTENPTFTKDEVKLQYINGSKFHFTSFCKVELDLNLLPNKL